MRSSLVGSLLLGVIVVVFSAASLSAAEQRGSTKVLRQVGAVKAAPVRVSVASQVVAFVPPEFPGVFRRCGVSGFVRLDVTVAADGRVIATHVVEATHAAFAIEARRAVRQWRFVPLDDALGSESRIVRVPIEFLPTSLR